MQNLFDVRYFYWLKRWYIFSIKFLQGLAMLSVLFWKQFYLLSFEHLHSFSIFFLFFIVWFRGISRLLHILIGSLSLLAIIFDLCNSNWDKTTQTYGITSKLKDKFFPPLFFSFRWKGQTPQQSDFLSLKVFPVLFFILGVQSKTEFSVVSIFSKHIVLFIFVFQNHVIPVFIWHLLLVKSENITVYGAKETVSWRQILWGQENKGRLEDQPFFLNFRQVFLKIQW